MRESGVKDHLVKMVKIYGGEARKIEWVGRNNAPDWRVMLPWVCAWAELKRPGEEPTEAQAREHERMRKYGEIVVVLDSIEAVNEWLALGKMQHEQRGFDFDVRPAALAGMKP